MRRFIDLILRCALLVAIACFYSAESARAADWPVEKMNRAIEQTNFVVDRGCSGTLVSVTERLILTNYHCIDSKVEVREREVASGDGTVKKVRQKRYADVPVEQNSYEGFVKVGTASYASEIVAEEKGRDLALLRLKGPLPNTYASPLGSNVQRGERVYAVGNPAGMENTVVEGIVSNINRTFEFSWTEEKLAMIQFSGGIYGGNSGGALYNARGELIGVPAAGMPAATFIGLAIPIHVVKAFLTANGYERVYTPEVSRE